MSRLLLLLPLLLLAIGTSASACSTPEVAPPPPNAPTTPPPGAPQPVRGEEGCEPKCEAPSTCITVVGRQPDSARKECWILCEGEGNKCPDGMKCVMMHDGPGEVCRPDRD